MFVWLEKVCDVCPYKEQLESRWDELLCCVLLYDVPLCWSPLGLRYPVPELTVLLQPQGALKGDLHVVVIVVSSCATG